MKNFLTSVCVFVLVFGVDSLIRVENTLPKPNSFPALILRKLILLPELAIPYEVVQKEDVKRKEVVKKFKFELFDVNIEAVNNFSIIYMCPKNDTSLKLKLSKTPECESELRVTTFINGHHCGSKNRKIYRIGYGMKIKRTIFPVFPPACQNLQDDEDAELERVQYPMYKSCFDVVEKKVYHVKYKLRSRNFIYNLKSSEIYTEEQYEMILQREREFLIEMALNFDGMPKMKRSEFEENDDEEDSPEETVPKLTILQSVLAFDFSQKKNEESYLIPFQLVSHEDVILYNWKVATFHEKNYSLIWSNVADNAWGKINWYLRDLMTRGDCDIDVYSGVHDYGKDGYPYYLWKFVRSNLKGIVIVIHNHPRGDKKDYGHLCKKYIDVSCERYGFPANEKEKDRGLTYCCPTSAVRNELPFFKDRFVELQPLESGHLCDRSQINPPYRPKYEKKLYSSFKSLPSTSTNVPYERISSLESSVHDPTPSKLNSTAGSPNTSSEIEGEREDVVDHQNARLTPSMERILEMIQSRMMEAGVDPTFYGPNPPRPGTALVATTPSQTTPGQTTPNQTTPGQTTPSQTGSDIDDGPDAVKTSSGWTSSMERNYEMVRNALVNKSWGRTSTNKSWGRTSSMVSSADSTTSAIPVEAN